MPMQCVAITGVSGGIGSALADAFAEKGAFVIGIDNQHHHPKSCSAFIEADLALVGRDQGAARTLCERIAQTCDGSLSTLVNNAAIQRLGPATELSWSNWRETLDVNLGAPFALSCGLYALLAMAGGSIINIGSVHATATKPGFAAYATSKSALHGLTRALAVEFGSSVRVTTLAPAAVDTSMLREGFEGNPEGFASLKEVHPLGRIASPTEIANAVCFLASPGAGFMSGSTLFMDGGILARLHDPE